MRTIRSLTSFPTGQSHNFATNPRVAISHVQWQSFFFLRLVPYSPSSPNVYTPTSPSSVQSPFGVLLPLAHLFMPFPNRLMSPTYSSTSLTLKPTSPGYSLIRLLIHQLAVPFVCRQAFHKPHLNTHHCRHCYPSVSLVVKMQSQWRTRKGIITKMRMWMWTREHRWWAQSTNVQTTAWVVLLSVSAAAMCWMSGFENLPGCVIVTNDNDKLW